MQKKGRTPPPPPPPVPAPFYFKASCLFLVVSGKPNSKDTFITGLDEECISVCIGAPAKDNEANKELLRYLAQVFKVRKSGVSLEKGGKSRHKLVRIEGSGLTVAEVETLLNAEIPR